MASIIVIMVAVGWETESREPVATGPSASHRPERVGSPRAGGTGAGLSLGTGLSVVVVAVANAGFCSGRLGGASPDFAD